MQKTTVVQRLSTHINACINCDKSQNLTWLDNHQDAIYDIERDYLPRGSGFDDGMHVYWKESDREAIIIYGAFHHMDEYGSYCGWTEHKFIVTPSFTNIINIDIDLTDNDTDMSDDEIRDTFDDFAVDALYTALTAQVD